MEVKRRELLTTAATVGAAALLLPTQILAQTSSSGTMEGYQARLWNWYYLHNEDASHQSNLRLFNVRDAGSSEELEQFILSLHSEPGATAMPTGHYAIAGKPFSLYIKHTATFWGMQVYVAEFALLV